MREHLERAGQQAGDLARWLREYRSPVEQEMTEEERERVRRAYEAAQRAGEH